MASLLSDRATTKMYLKIEENIKRSSSILFVLFPQPKLFFFSGLLAGRLPILAIFSPLWWGKGWRKSVQGGGYFPFPCLVFYADFVQRNITVKISKNGKIISKMCWKYWNWAEREVSGCFFQQWNAIPMIFSSEIECWWWWLFIDSTGL